MIIRISDRYAFKVGDLVKVSWAAMFIMTVPAGPFLHLFHFAVGQLRTPFQSRCVSFGRMRYRSLEEGSGFLQSGAFVER